MTGFHHISVLLDEVLGLLEPWRGGLYVDGTLGGAGHSLAMLQAAAKRGVEIQLLGIDRDPQALAAAAARLHDFSDQITLVKGNYRDLSAILSENDLGPVQGLLIDAGVSSHQLDTAERGFSFSKEGPLDMRMGPDARTAAEVIDESSEADLGRTLGRYGEVRGARRLAAKLKRARSAGELETTTQLAALCGPPSRKKKVHPATMVFQALRIAANDELAGLEQAVEALPEVLDVGGRAAFISFHSLEDRIVKHGLRELADPCTCPPALPMCACGAVAKIEILGKLIRPSQAEVDRNPRSRSARLRGALRVEPKP